MNEQEEKELKLHLRKSDLRKPFERTRLNSDEKGKVITLRLNDEELAILEEQKELLDTDLEGATFKFFWKAGWNVTQSNFWKESLRWIASETRVRKLKKPHKNIQNVIQNVENQEKSVTQLNK